MKTDKVETENKGSKVLIKGVKRLENATYIKSFDYYYKRALTTYEQKGEINPNIPPKEIFEGQILKSLERKRVREFKKRLEVKNGYDAYQKNIENTAEMQEKNYRKENDNGIEIDQ